MTGQHSWQTNVVHNGNTLEPKVPGLGDVFQKNGYHTGYVGKWHLYQGENEFVPKGAYRFGFEDWHAWANTNKHYDGITFDQETGERIIMPGYQPTRMTDQAIEFIQKQKGADKPWFLVLSWNPPHPPYDPPPTERDQYDANSLKLRPNVRLFIPADKITNPYPQLESFETLHVAAQGYYGAITPIDKEFDRLLRALDESGMANDTVVVYTSDHGEMMGSHGHMAKQMPHEESPESHSSFVCLARKGNAKPRTLSSPQSIFTLRFADWLGFPFPPIAVAVIFRVSYAVRAMRTHLK